MEYTFRKFLGVIKRDVCQVYKNGYHGDCSAMFLLGDVDEKGRRLSEATRQCLMSAIAICRPGQTFAAIGNCI